MDSLSQIVLGAAVGEAHLGRKIGNKAMVWGAIAGTIPDLDVVSNLWMDQIDSLAFHRGISHSLFFSVLMAGGMAYLVRRWYTRPSLAPDLKDSIGTVTYKQWCTFFFMTLFTHPLLDCCTAYGTQLWAPFSDTRIAWNIISVADPLWTLPFGISLLIVSRLHRLSKARRIALYIGIGWASAYMLWCASNKQRVDRIMQATIAQMDIDAIRYTTGPSILNNILWSGTVEAENDFYLGTYSLLDRKPSFKLIPLPKNHDLIQAAEDDHVVNTLRWFSNEYYNVITRRDGRLQINDLRYGSTRARGHPGEDDFVFRFVLERTSDGYILDEAEGGPPRGGEKEMMNNLIKRVKGI